MRTSPTAKSLEEQLRQARIQVERLRTEKATMRTVQDIVSNALMSLQLFRTQADPNVSPQALNSFDHIVAETAAQLKAIGDLEQVTDTDMILGPGIEYQPPADGSTVSCALIDGHSTPLADLNVEG